MITLYQAHTQPYHVSSATEHGWKNTTYSNTYDTYLLTSQITSWYASYHSVYHRLSTWPKIWRSSHLQTPYQSSYINLCISYSTFFVVSLENHLQISILCAFGDDIQIIYFNMHRSIVDFVFSVSQKCQYLLVVLYYCVDDSVVMPR